MSPWLKSCRAQGTDMVKPCPFLLLKEKLPHQTLPRLWERRVGILDQLHELSLEPAAGDRGIWQSARQIVAVQLIPGVGRVAHAIEALTARVLRTLRDERARPIGLARWLDPHEGIDARDRVRRGPRADPRAVLVAPIPFVNALVDARCHDECTEVCRGTCGSGSI